MSAFGESLAALHGAAQSKPTFYEQDFVFD
jgi:hypothetical protein